MRPPSSFSESAYMGLGGVFPIKFGLYPTYPTKGFGFGGGSNKLWDHPEAWSIGEKGPKPWSIGEKGRRGCGITIIFEVIFVVVQNAPAG